jgi:inorganic pyrophosphatase
MRYPADHGFIEGTRGMDGDPLDALGLLGEPTFPGCRIRVRPVGLFRMCDEKGPDPRIICVPLRDPPWSEAQDLSDLPQTLLNEIEHFCAVYNDLEERPVSTEGWGSLQEAKAEIPHAKSRVEGGPVSASVLPWPTVERGAEHHPLRTLQYLLRARTEHVLVVDGSFGPLTETAGRDFQRGAGLAAKGVVGPITWPTLVVQ